MKLLFFVVALIVENCSATTKIINGELAVDGQFPHMVQLSIKRKDSTKYCGGSLLNSQWVLTAAHCCNEMTSAKAYLGSVFMRSMLLKLKIVDASIHPLYKNVNAHDIALLKLEKPVVFSHRIRSIRLPEIHENSIESLVNSTLAVPGFGETKNGSQSNLYLRYVKMKEITNEECCDEWGWHFNETLLCASGLMVNETTCQGDSGNGLIRQDNDGKATVLGIVSYGAQGCVGKPKVFTRVSKYLDFIRSVTEIKT